MGAMASQITSLTIIYSNVYSGADQRKHQSFASLAFVCLSSMTGEFPAQMASNAENVSIWWCHHVVLDIAALHRFQRKIAAQYDSDVVCTYVIINDYLW